MPKIKLTKSKIEKLLYQGKIIDYYDDEISGLCLRIGKHTKTFYYKTDVKDSTKKTGYRSVRTKIGRYGDITLEQAREIIHSFKDSIHVYVPRKRLEIKRSELLMKKTDDSLEILLEEYLQKIQAQNFYSRNPTIIQDNRRKRACYFREWMKLSLDEIMQLLTPDNIIEKHNQIKATKGPHEALQTITLLHALFSYANLRYPSFITANLVDCIIRAEADILA